MEDENDQDTKLTLYFPDNYDDSIAKCLEFSEKRYAVIGEVITIIVIAEYDGENNEAQISEWRQKIESLQTLSTVSPSASSAEHEKDFQFKNYKNTNIPCQPIYSYKEDPLKKLSEPLLKVNRDLLLWSEDDKWTSLSRTTLACTERVSLENVPANCAECSVSVALWLPLMESSTSSSSNILESFLKYSPEVIMHQQLGKCIQRTVVKSMSLIPVPVFTCRHYSTVGKNFISLSVSNHHPSGLILSNVRVHPNVKESFTSPISEVSSMTDSATLESDCGENSEVIKVVRSGKNNHPATLNPLEVMNFTFSVQVNESIGVSDQGQTIYLMAIVTWTKADVEDRIITHYRLPTLQVRKPSLVITAVPVNETSQKEVQVKFTVVNNLQDFSSLKFIWSPEKALQENRARENEAYRRSIQNVIKSVVCCDPSVHLGACKMGTVVTAVVGFKILTPGVYELGQHMKLKLQYQNSSSMPGHQRKGSITSTHSMPAEPRRDIHPTVTTRSASMCPLSEQETGSGRRGSVTSTHSFTPSWTPPDASPAHIPASTLHRNSSHGNLTSGSTFKPHHNRVPSYGSYIVTPSSRPSSAVSSPSRPMPVVSSSQVLKRNCQVYYQQIEVDPA